jgi:Asp-tRNA(Asn)/Glu-tRNA(Gln) amidotransferase B subunit
MRAKADAIGYRYFTEPNIININIQKLIDRTQLDEKTTPDHIRETLLAQKINRDLVDQLVTNHELYRIYDYVNKAVNDPALTVT